MSQDESQRCWVVIDTGFERYLGRVVDGFGYRNGKQVPVKDSPAGLVGKPEVVLDRVVRIATIDRTTREDLVRVHIPLYLTSRDDVG